MSSSHDVAVLVVGPCDIPLWRLSPLERLRREFGNRGIALVVDSVDAIPAGVPCLVVLRGDVAYDPVLIRALAETDGLALTLPGSDVVAGLHAPVAEALALAERLAAGGLTAGDCADRGLHPAPPEAAAGPYRDALRKREAPFLLPVRRGDQRAVERRLFGGAYKGVTDIVTKYLWPEPAFWATQACVRLGLTPNMVTFASLLLVIAAFVLFAAGWFWLGLVAAWLMTFLDTVDGKLARVSVSYTRFGNVFDHGIDLIHPPFWYWAWMMGLGAIGAAPQTASILLAVIIGGYVLQRMAEGLFIARHKLEMHIWRRWDSRFRLITARRNPNLVILTVAMVADAPGTGITAVAVWTALCLGVHLLQILQAEVARRSGPLTSWLAG